MRYIADFVADDLAKKMVFLGGPRQVGKTTLAQSLLASRFDNKGRYFNWDDDDDRRDLMAKQWSDDDRLLVFDELHKFPRWKNWLKGIYDTRSAKHRFLVTGSARLDVYRRGGDSLLGRYHHWRLHPFSMDELPQKMAPREGLARLLTCGGFPEPFLDGSERAARRWRKERFDRVLREDVRDLEPIREIRNLELLVDLLRQRVGSPIVVSNLAEDLHVAPKTVAHWLEVLERMYLIFTIRPYAGRLTRTLVKPPKVFFFDNGDVIGDEGARFENLVASSLLKRIQLLEDHDGYRYNLAYVRDKEGHEVDFVILKEGKIIALVEAKWSDDRPAPSLRYFAERLHPIHAVQIVGSLKRPYTQDGLRVVSGVDELPRLSFLASPS